MGWMSWEIFRCNIDCSSDPDSCISESLYKTQADALAAGGYLDAGYSTIHADGEASNGIQVVSFNLAVHNFEAWLLVGTDCWEQKDPPRDPKTDRLRADPTRFPNGMKALVDYVHGKGAKFGLYTAESPTTCGGYPASANHEGLDAQTFAGWGVDYMKVDGCGPADYYATGYKAMGVALEASGRDIVYSCSWPAYLGSNETTKPFPTFINDGCNLWRNYADIQCNWGSLSDIIDHWGDYGEAIAPFAGPGHWNDPDMLIIGNECISDAEERTQMAIWSIVAAPLIMGNDLRNVSASSRAILLNEHAIGVNQDPLGQQGLRLANSSAAATQVWARNLASGAVAVGLYNKGGYEPIPPRATVCSNWTEVTDGYYEACGGSSGDLSSFSGLTVAQAKDACCSYPTCVGFSFKGGSGYFKNNAECGITHSTGYSGYTISGQIPVPITTPQDITVKFSDVGLFGPVDVFDAWRGKSLGTFNGSYTAQAVANHDTAFLILTPK